MAVTSRVPVTEVSVQYVQTHLVVQQGMCLCMSTILTTCLTASGTLGALSNAAIKTWLACALCPATASMYLSQS